MKHTTLVLFALAGCGTVIDPPGEEPPIDPAVLSFIPTRIHDQRSDAIDFSIGQPVHTHTGATVTLGGADCPAVYHYAYLLERTPAYGRELTPDPLAFELALPVDAARTAYRVTTAQDQILLDWTPLSEGETTIALHRDDIAELGTRVGQLHLDVRVRDAGGTEQLVSACWDHHPLAAPIAIETPQISTGPSSLAARTLTRPSYVVDVIRPLNLRNVEVFTQRIVQQTAEPITLELAAAAPSGTFATTLVDTYAVTGVASGNKDCDAEPAYCVTTPPAEPADVTGAGAISTGTWASYVVDETSGAVLPCPAGVCTIGPRAIGAAPHAYRAVVTARQFANLWPSSAPVYDQVLGGRAFTGSIGPIKIRCSNLQVFYSGGVGHSTCVDWVESTEVLALDRARLDLSPTPIRVSTGIADGPRSAVPYLPEGTTIAPAVSWDGGDGPF